MTIYIAAFLTVLVLVYIRLPQTYEARLLAFIVLFQTAGGYLISDVAGYGNTLFHAAFYCVIGLALLVLSPSRNGSALGIVSFLISLVFVGGYFDIISTTTGLGLLAPTVWNFSTVLCYLQLVVLWELGNGIRNRNSYY